MKRIFKKNQIIVTALAVMIAVAGYLNYSGKLFGEPATDAGNELTNQELLDITLEGTGDIGSLENEITTTPGEAILTSGIIAEAKLTREQVRAQNKETLMEIINNKNLSEQQKEDAINQMIEMTKIAEQEAAIETMLLSKGFTEVVVTMTNGGVDVVVNKTELTDVNRAQIEDVVKRKTGVSPENIVIVPMKE